MTGSSPKKSFIVSLDYVDPEQRLYGYRTLNLLNGHSDPSFLREVLYLRIARQYMPAPKANFVRLVINGESWGVYVNVQQFNNDFLRDWYGTTDGVRWKVPAGRSGGGSLAYSGDDPAAYSRAYELKDEDETEAWQDLVDLTSILNETPEHELEGRLGEVFDIDGALWQIALENVFIDGDGYISRGSDYQLYLDPEGRFHMVPYDNNETFKYAVGGGPNRWPSRDPMLSPLAHEGNPMLPVISRLLAIPHLRARYLAHIRTLVDEWLDWKTLGPVVERYRGLIEAEVESDDKKLYSYDAFVEGIGDSGWDGSGGSGRGSLGGFSTPSLQSFVAERREFLLSHPEIARATPVIRSVLLPIDPKAGATVTVTANVRSPAELDAVLLYYAAGNDSASIAVPMVDDGAHADGRAGDAVYGARIPAFPAGTTVRCYVEARAVTSLQTTVFEPRSTGWGAYEYRVGLVRADGGPVVINELMALNSSTLADPQGDFDDWIELHNASAHEVDLSGMYLTDSEGEPRKWAFPEGAAIPAWGYLVVWADGDDGAAPGLHTDFRLSGDGEVLLLVDADARGNRILDYVRFDRQEPDVSYGRLPNGLGDFRETAASPGRGNEP